MSETATWRSGYATVCKTVYPGSIPGVASNDFSGLEVCFDMLANCVSDSSAFELAKGLAL